MLDMPPGLSRNLCRFLRRFSHNLTDVAITVNFRCLGDSHAPDKAPDKRRMLVIELSRKIIEFFRQAGYPQPNDQFSPGMKSLKPRSSRPRVALLIESSRAYGRGLLVGIARYVREQGPW